MSQISNGGLMIFSSFTFILAFLPISVIGYYLCNRYLGLMASRIWLIGASFYFYAQWKFDYLGLLIISILINFALSQPISQRPRHLAKYWLIGGIAFNLLLLGYFKYTNFALDSFNQLTHGDFFVADILLPLAISFFTFQQIAYLVDSYIPHKRPESGFLNYCLFVSFFPQLIAGPIVHHKEMIPQFKQNVVSAENIAKGLAIFTLGLFKKVALADTLAIWANAGFSQSGSIDFVNAWLTSLCYTFQLYFDFSGYADMAIGAALLFNIVLPLNFNSPYRATSIQLFWRNWHMTLSRWFRDYVYFPLGGNKQGQRYTVRNLVIVAILSGIWHGAGWTFLIWGAMHALALAVNRLWQSYRHPLPVVIAWLLTFLFINVSWVMFRAESVEQALQMYHAMLSLNDVALIDSIKTALLQIKSTAESISWQWLFDDLTHNTLLQCLMITIGLMTCLTMPNSQTLIGIHTTAKIDIRRLIPTLIITCLAVVAFALLALGNYSEFIYFNF